MTMKITLSAAEAQQLEYSQLAHRVLHKALQRFFGVRRFDVGLSQNLGMAR
jgi:hypothetical protein